VRHGLMEHVCKGMVWKSGHFLSSDTFFSLQFKKKVMLGKCNLDFVLYMWFRKCNLKDSFLEVAKINCLNFRVPKKKHAV